MGAGDLTLDSSASNRPAEFSPGTGANGLVMQPTTLIVASATNAEFNVSITPTVYGSFSIVLTIYSDDPDEGTYTIEFTGTSTKKSGGKDEESCSTSEQHNWGFLALLVALAWSFAAARLRRA